MVQLVNGRLRWQPQAPRASVQAGPQQNDLSAGFARGRKDVVEEARAYGKKAVLLTTGFTGGQHLEPLGTGELRRPGVLEEPVGSSRLTGPGRRDPPGRTHDLRASRCVSDHTQKIPNTDGLAERPAPADQPSLRPAMRPPPVSAQIRKPKERGSPAKWTKRKSSPFDSSRSCCLNTWISAPSSAGAMCRSWLNAPAASSYRLGSVIPVPTKLIKAARSGTRVKPSRRALSRSARASKSTNRDPSRTWASPLVVLPSMVEEGTRHSWAVSSPGRGRDLPKSSPEPDRVLPRWKSQLMRANISFTVPL